MAAISADTGIVKTQDHSKLKVTASILNDGIRYKHFHYPILFLNYLIYQWAY